MVVTFFSYIPEERYIFVAVFVSGFFFFFSLLKIKYCDPPDLNESLPVIGYAPCNDQVWYFVQNLLFRQFLIRCLPT